MPIYNFKQIPTIPSSGDLVDIVLTRTQRRTPTVVHPGYKIARIRAFYMRKVKFTQQTISEKLGSILSTFPRLNDIHPFYADLCNTLYDRDHYKLALGQINVAKNLCDAIARDMVRMIKYGDSAYRCKCLKRAALGRMCTVLKRQKSALAYLEEVRKHLGRLPSLDPNTRTILLCGLPNVGKSSFMNKITRANVDVQPYAFTTKSLFVGHTDYRYLRWQVIDTPGILDHPLEERNTIEMQAITALAHLTCSVLFFIDISEQCGYTIEQQISLFKSIKPLFVNKQLIIVVNKIDQQPWATLDADKKDLIEEIINDGNTTMIEMSNISEEGVSNVKATACDKLLAARVDSRVSGNKVEGILNRLQVFNPAPRDDVVREASIPDSVKEKMENGTYVNKERKPRRSTAGYAPTKDSAVDGDVQMGDKSDRKLARDLMWENGGPGVWAPDYREQYDLENDEWKFDAIPEIMDGKNIADFIDPDIDKKLASLEMEEDQLIAEAEAAAMGRDDSDLDSDEEALVGAIREKRNIIRGMAKTNKSTLPRTARGRGTDKHNVGVRSASEIKKKMDEFGIDTSKMIERGRTLERGRKRERSLSRRRRDDSDNENSDVEMSLAESEGLSNGQKKKLKQDKKEKAKRDASLARSHSRPREPSQMGLRDEAMAKKATKAAKRGNKEWFGLSGEGDQRKTVHLVQWMNTGKKRMGTHNKR